MSSFFEIRRGLDSLAGAGGATIFVSPANGITGTFVALQALEDSVIDINASSAITAQTGQNLNNLPLKAGVSVLGLITNWDLVSGKVVAYRQLA